jgi:hypothetical protein
VAVRWSRSYNTRTFVFQRRISARLLLSQLPGRNRSVALSCHICLRRLYHVAEYESIARALEGYLNVRLRQCPLIAMQMDIYRNNDSPVSRGNSDVSQKG